MRVDGGDVPPRSFGEGQRLPSRPTSDVQDSSRGRERAYQGKRLERGRIGSGTFLREATVDFEEHVHALACLTLWPSYNSTKPRFRDRRVPDLLK